MNVKTKQNSYFGKMKIKEFITLKLMYIKIIIKRIWHKKM